MQALGDPTSLRSLIDSEAAKHPDRAPQKNEVYLRLYPEKVKEVYELENQSKLNPGARLNKLKAIAQTLLQADTDEVKEKVDLEIQKWRREKAESMKNLAGSADSNRAPPTPEEYQRCESIYLLIYFTHKHVVL